MSFDLGRLIRRLKPQRISGALGRRPDAELQFIIEPIHPGPELLLDTTVYIDGLTNRSPRTVDDLMAVRVCNHSAVCLSELTHAFGRLDPAHAGTKSALATISQLVAGIRPHRLREPSVSAWGTAGVLAGLVFRLGNYANGDERKLLNDALVFLQALENGQVVVTGNIKDFDLLSQLVPEGRILFYSADRRK